MSYLIPKSARNVKLQIFKGLGFTEGFMVLFAILISLAIFYTEWNIYFKPMLVTFIGLVTIFLVSPSFIANKKGYQSFDTIFNFVGAQKKFIKKKSKR